MSGIENMSELKIHDKEDEGDSNQAEDQLQKTSGLISDSDEEDDEIGEHPKTDGEEEEEALPVQYGGQIIDDPNIESIAADSDLTSDLPLDAEDIDLIHLRIESIEDLELEKFKNLKRLCLRENTITSFSCVDELEGLEELDLYDNRINHISKSLRKLSKLSSLDLSFNKIKNIKNLENLEHLKSLYFVQNKIEHIKNISHLSNLRVLELGGNKIRSIENLDGLDNLEELWLGKNKITKLQNLNLPNLKILSIQSNRIVKIEGLENLKNLEELYLSHNGISKIENLDENQKLTVLDVTSNKIEKVENIAKLTKLTDFWASFTKIDSFENVFTELKNFKELDTVYLEGTPLQRGNQTSYRRKIILNLPQLSKLDATYVR